jgi:cobalamin biosynthetic protein CobC
MASASSAPVLSPHAIRHGGRLREAQRAYPHAPAPWLDLSTGISPWAWNGPRASRFDLRRLPDTADLLDLERAAARSFGVDPQCVVATAGAEAGIGLLAATLALDAVDIVAPTYGGHAQAWMACGAAVHLVSGADAIRSRASGLVIVNPNNPDGRTWPRVELLRLAAERSARAAWTIVDEAFVEAQPALGVAAAVSDRLVVLRSFGKFYGLAGVRLGFVIAEPFLAARLRSRLGDWPVCADAITLGQAAYADDAWADRQRTRLARSAARLDRLLRRAGFEIVGGTSLFRLTASADASRRFERLSAAGILTRPFEQDGAWLRFGLPGPRDWPRLEAALC